MHSALRALALFLAPCGIAVFGMAASAFGNEASVEPPVLAKDLTSARTPGKVSAVLWTVRTDHCTLQVVFPNAARVPRNAKTPDVQVWLLKADGTTIAPTRRLDPSASDKNLRQPMGTEILFDFPLSADRDAVAAAIRVDDVFHIESITPRR